MKFKHNLTFSFKFNIGFGDDPFPGGSIYTSLRTTRAIPSVETGKWRENFGAISRETPLFATLPLYLNEPRLPICPPNPAFGKYPTHRRRRFLLQALRMPQQDAQNGSHEVKEPTPKIAKLHENGDVSGNAAPFFRVKKLSEKAVLPARGSPLSAGYDLSR